MAPGENKKQGGADSKITHTPTTQPPTNDGKPTPRARTIAASIALGVVLFIILAEAFGPAFGLDIKLPPSAYPLLIAVLIFWFNLKLNDLGRKKDQ